MFGLGPTELIFIIAIALIIFGPRRLPEMGKAIGKAIREFKKVTQEVEGEIKKEISEIEEIKEEVKVTKDLVK